MNRIQHKVLAAIATALSGCVATAPVNYSPISSLSATGSLTVTRFAYLPADSGKVKPNQIRNTALGSLTFGQDVHAFFRDAVFKELRGMGVKVDDPSKSLSGEIHEFLIDDLGFSVDWTLRVKYQLTSGGTVTFEGVKEVKRKTSKGAYYLETLNETIKLNIEELVKDKAFLNAIK